MEVIVRSGIIVMGILFIRKWAMGKITRKLQYYIWGILPAVLLIFPYVRIPVPFLGEKESPGLINWQDEAGYAKANVMGKILWEGYYPDNQKNSSKEQNENNLDAEDKRKAENQTGAWRKFFYEKNLLEIIRNIITAALLCFTLGANGIFAAKLLKRRIFFKEDGETKVKIYLLEECATPFLFGNNIYLNPDMTRNAETMRYMILHEYCHMKQGDLFFCLVKNILCAVYWFDPFVWMAVHFINRDCELACDEAVIKIIGANKRQEYGMTLLELFREKSADRSFVIGTFMGGKKSMLKERILFLSKPLHKKKSGGWTFVVLAGCILLTGCSLMGKVISEGQQDTKEVAGVYEKQKNPEKEAADGERQTAPEYADAIAKKEINAEMFMDLENNYYNTVKENEGQIYFNQSDYLCSMDLNSKAVNQLEKGRFLLGNIDGDYLYYIKHPAAPEDEGGIGRMNLTTMEQQILIPWNEEYWSCTEIYSKDGCFYIENGNGCEAFWADGGKAVKLDEQENKIANAVKPFEDLLKEAPAMNYGYINSIFRFQVFAAKDSKTGTLYICDTKEKRSVKKTDCMGDVLVSEYGVIYLMLNGDIYLSPLDNLDENRLMFSAGENGKGVTYGTYDKNGLYVFENNGDTVKCKCILWKGGIVDVKEFSGIRLSIDLKLSAFTDFIVYFENEKINLI